MVDVFEIVMIKFCRSGTTYWYLISMAWYAYSADTISYAGMVPSETRCYGSVQHGTMLYRMVLLIYQTESQLSVPYWYGTVMPSMGGMANFGHYLVAW